MLGMYTSEVLSFIWKYRMCCQEQINWSELIKYKTQKCIHNSGQTSRCFEIHKQKRRLVPPSLSIIFHFYQALQYFSACALSMTQSCWNATRKYSHIHPNFVLLRYSGKWEKLSDSFTFQNLSSEIFHVLNISLLLYRANDKNMPYISTTSEIRLKEKSFINYVARGVKGRELLLIRGVFT